MNPNTLLKELSLREPSVLEHFRTWEARPLFFVKHLSKQVFRIIRHRLPLWLIKIQVSVQDIILSLFFVLANEWHAPSKHSVQHDTEGPNISFTRMRLLGDNLRWTVGKGTIRVYRALQPRNQDFAQTKVYQLRLKLIGVRDVNHLCNEVFFLRHHNIFELDVSMNDSAIMQVVHDFHNLSEKNSCHSLYGLFIVFDPVE